MKSIVFFTKYGNKAASTRYRFSQFFLYLEANGFECKIYPLLGDKYLTNRFSTGAVSWKNVLQGYVKRFFVLLDPKMRESIAVVYSELFPFLPLWLERFLLKRPAAYVYDFDDAFYLSYTKNKIALVRLLFSGKISGLIKNAGYVCAGNRNLAEYARKYSKKIAIIPTVVDARKYSVKGGGESGEKFVVGWIGSAVTSPYLLDIADRLAEFRRSCPSDLVVVGATAAVANQIGARFVPWSEDTEIKLIRTFDVGIMPLPDTEWAAGKSAFKIIQYMACGVPVIASAVGANTYVVEHERTGYLANSGGDWLRFLEILYSNKTKRTAMGTAGRKKFEMEYSSGVVSPILKDIFNTI